MNILDKLNLQRLDRSRESAITHMEHALHGQDGGRRVPNLPITYFVLHESNGQGKSVTVLHLARWTSTGRCSVHRVPLNAMSPVPGEANVRRFAYGRLSKARRVWFFDMLTFDCWPADEYQPDDEGLPAFVRMAQVCKPLKLDHSIAYEKLPPAPGSKQEYNRKYYNKRVMSRLVNHMPAGYQLLPGAKVPRAYIVEAYTPKHSDIPSLRVRVAKAKPGTRALDINGRDVEAEDDEAIHDADLLSYSTYPIYGTAIIAGQEYHLAADRRTLYRKGADEDIYSGTSARTQIRIEEATLAFYERAPTDALRVPGHLATYEINARRRIVTITWYLHTGAEMQDIVGISGGAITWRGTVYFIAPTGALIPAVA